MHEKPKGPAEQASLLACVDLLPLFSSGLGSKVPRWAKIGIFES